MEVDNRVIDVLMLGTGGMMPLPNRWLSSLLLRTAGHLTLFDCGEGTQIPWRRFSWGFRRVSTICITHLHADHVAGLPGVLFSIAHAGRTEPVTIYGPPGVRSTVAHLRTIAPDTGYPVEVIEVEGGAEFTLPSGLRASTLWGDHRLPCLSYRLDLPRAPRFNVDLARSLDIPVERWQQLQSGAAIDWKGTWYEEGAFLGPMRTGISFGFVTDTRPVPNVSEFLTGVDLLVCEGIYGDDADLAKAVDKKHMIFSEAATIARDAGAGALWLTHFSPAMDDPEAYRHVAAAIFPNVTVGYSGLTTSLTFPQDD